MSEFGESELSDLESSNDEYTQSAAKAKAAEKKKAAAKKTAQANSIIKGALKPPRPTTYTTQALYGTFEQQHHSVHRNPDPNWRNRWYYPFAYQPRRRLPARCLSPFFPRVFLGAEKRCGSVDVVWNDVKQSNLIGSIFQNYYVPPIIFATQPHDDGSEIKVCIDGKQRLTSMRRFMDGLIPREWHSVFRYGDMT